MIRISNQIEFNEHTGRHLQASIQGMVDDISDWPVVYILSNDKEAYVGETTNVMMRLNQHLGNVERQRLTSVRIISDQTFNKSVVLGLESFLIAHMSADSRFDHLQNGNFGQQKHNYYQKDFYESQFDEVWTQLQALHLVQEDLHDVENSNLFKYSPYKTLTADQYATCYDIVRNIADKTQLGQNSTTIVNGDPGTGKTVLAVYLAKMLLTKTQNDATDETDGVVASLNELRRQKPNLKIGLVIPMQNLRTIVEQVFDKTYGLHKGIILSPSKVVSDEDIFDILIVDEAHRLKAARNMSGFSMKNMYDNNLRLGLNERAGTQLDWILKKSRHRVLFYDANQTIKRTDVGSEQFQELLDSPNTNILTLHTQLRCGKDGQEYVDYIKAIFSDNPPTQRHFDTYDVRLFNNVRQMTDLIRKKDQAHGVGLSRNVAGYAWPWKTKDNIAPRTKAETEACIANGDYDIEIDGNRYIWNTIYNGWATSENAVNEIGCIHTIQGFDLNYAGVIIGDELIYSPEAKRFYVDAANYHDSVGKLSTSEEDLLRYIINIYKILLTRGMRGTYIYACNQGVRDYLAQFFPSV